MMPGEIGLSGANDSRLFSVTDRILGWLGGLAGLDFDEDQHIAVPSDDVHFPVFGPVAGGHDPISQRAEVIDTEKLGPPPKRQKSVKQERKRHSPVSCWRSR